MRGWMTTGPRLPGRPGKAPAGIGMPLAGRAQGPGDRWRATSRESALAEGPCKRCRRAVRCLPRTWGGTHMTRVLVTGGAGYLGCVLVPQLLAQGYSVTVLDALAWGGEGLFGCFINPHFEFVEGDVCDAERVRALVRKHEVVVHLAACAGYPRCERQPEEARRTNIDGCATIAACLSRDQLLIFASTSSVYGSASTSICTEDTPPVPESLYAVTKAQGEGLLRDKHDPVVLRFATAFGLSPRMRLDLLPNDFAYQALHSKALVIYEGQFKRSFIHVRDMASSILFSLEECDDMRGRVFNVGSEAMNMTKSELAQRLQRHLDFYVEYAEIGRDLDRRNYFLSYDRLRQVGFQASVGLDEGLAEAIKGISALRIGRSYSNS